MSPSSVHSHVWNAVQTMTHYDQDYDVFTDQFKSVLFLRSAGDAVQSSEAYLGQIE